METGSCLGWGSGVGPKANVQGHLCTLDTCLVSPLVFVTDLKHSS